MRYEKERLCVRIPARLCERLNSDAKNFGVAKSYVVAVALSAYYSNIDGQPPARIPTACQGTMPGVSPAETP